MKALTLKSVEIPESDIQHAVLFALKMRKDVAWVHRFNTGAHAFNQIDAQGRHRRRFVRYAFPGCSDILGQMTDGRFLAVEVKRRTGKLTAEQRRFLNLVSDNGGVAFVARDVQDVINNLGK